jgi:hypothetical protein
METVDLMPKNSPNKHPKFVSLHLLEENIPLKFRRERSIEDDLMNLASLYTIKALMPLGNIAAISRFIEAHTGVCGDL